MKLLIAGGGTGGHLFPGIAVAEEFLSRGAGHEVLFVGTEKGIEAKAVPASGYKLECVSAAGIRGKGSFSKIKAVAMMLYGYAESRKILKRWRPDMVLGVGGYASLPMVMAAKGMQIPCFIHEQNAIPGFTNRMLAKFADHVFITLSESAKFFPEKKILLTGNPLRRQILAQALQPVPEERTDINSKFRVLVFGGSQGAHAINMAFVSSLPLLRKISDQLEITHQTGAKELEAVRTGYQNNGVNATVVAFIDNMAEVYRNADFIICRAGATTIAEVTACGKVCLFIPFPHAVDDHQRKNAEALLKLDACFMLIEHELTPERVADHIFEMMRDPEKLAKIGANARKVAHLNATKVIVDEMTKIVASLAD